MSAATTLQALLDKMWLDYIIINPLAQKIHDLLSKGEHGVFNDHIALRTFNHPRITIDVIARPFIGWGYHHSGDYQFPEKKLRARSYQHSDLRFPKIFISEIKLEEFSPALRTTINGLVDEIPLGEENMAEFSSSGRPWKLRTKAYHNLLKESDYAAWVAAFGFRPNHFTVLINDRKKFSDIRELNDHLKANGFKLNSSGGEVKGSPELLLEQSSTLANNIDVNFEDGVLNIPGCYYEFCRRYPMKDGRLYQGFVAASADKIFESTYQGQ